MKVRKGVFVESRLSWHYFNFELNERQQRMLVLREMREKMDTPPAAAFGERMMRAFNCQGRRENSFFLFFSSCYGRESRNDVGSV